MAGLVGGPGRFVSWPTRMTDAEDRAAQIRCLNDNLRQTGVGGRRLVSAGVAALTPDTLVSFRCPQFRQEIDTRMDRSFVFMDYLKGYTIFPVSRVMIVASCDVVRQRPRCCFRAD